MTPDEAKALREPFPPELIGKLPKAGLKLDYVGHAAVTDRLLQVDPAWTWQPLTPDELAALPCNDDGMWIKMTVADVTRFGYGDGPDPKQRISDAIRNAAMRFGVALDLWAKEDLSGVHEESAPAPKPGRAAQKPGPSAGATPPASADGPAPPDKITAAVDRVKTLKLEKWVSEQHYPWPYEQAVVDAINARCDLEVSRS